MASAVVYEGDVQRSEQTLDGLFGGQKLWFSRTVPSREWMMRTAAANGAQIVQLEQQADVKLTDHARKNQAPGTYSYRYVELSVRNGNLEDLETHRIGSTLRVDRPVGSIVTASKGTRNKFTDADDQLLWNWLKPYMDAGGHWKGNEIFKQLERLYPNHTFQSWRDRWIKHTQYQQRQITAPTPIEQQGTYDQADENPVLPKRRKLLLSGSSEIQQANVRIVQSEQAQISEAAAQLPVMGNVESTSSSALEKARSVAVEEKPFQLAPHSGQPTAPAIDAAATNNIAVVEVNQRVKGKTSDAPSDAESSVSADAYRLPLLFDFTQDEARMLYKATCYILDTHPNQLDASWAGVTREYGHSKEAWSKYFHTYIVPEYMKRHGIRDETELQTHVKMKLTEVRKQRALKRREARLKKAINDETTDVESGQENGDTSDTQRDEQQSMGFNGKPDTDFEETSTKEKDNEDQQHMLRIRADHSSLQPPTSSTTTVYQPPKPNESRKLSQGKSSQSTSTQSQSQTSVAPKLQPLPSVQASQPSEVTASQVDDATEMGIIIPAQRLRTAIQVKSEAVLPRYFDSPLASSQHEMRPRSRSRDRGQPIQRYGKTQTQPEIASSPPNIQLLDGEDLHSNIDNFSDIAPSEAPSEMIEFESNATLSGVWETAPDQVDQNAAYVDEADDQDEYLTTKSIIDAESQNMGSEPRRASWMEETTEHDFETAPQSIRATTRATSTSSAKESTATKHRLNTQALFQQPTQDNLAELVALPEPPGGWDDEEEPTAILDTPRQRVQNKLAANDVDWTLPLPDPALSPTNTREPLHSDASPEGADVDTWLAQQSELYATIPSLLLTPLSHHALEVTSMDLNLASRVLSLMVQRHQTGKYPGHSSFKRINEVPRVEQKRLISRIVVQLTPSDLRGCWTRLDDEALNGVDARQVRRLEDKHGGENVKNRFEFLEMWLD